ncbi:peptidoglycan synthetase FtsI [Sulfurivirga caldicuralii]|uniref:Peptidoglycan D,D-transpeptidase FtsI n=1 Tax=Sulfurivirga caldicuralii TaxID=364032 RepID=A0A1N6DVH7_9GAMM|nr:penicillin-binding protein 2 [Sulfurivirga caldicuralii]SIN74750.1 peptidoglycan synthetase FtsI [Sulfurivirga caldicuralii]
MKIADLRAVLKREHWVLAGLIIAMLVLTWRAWSVQIEQAAFLKAQAQLRHVRMMALPASRGVIYDRNQQVLALSTPVADVWVDPKLACARIEDLKPLAKLLGQNWTSLKKRISGRCSQRFLYLRRQVLPALAERIKALSLPGVYVNETYKRYYPEAETAAHLIGFTNIDDQGQAGLEKSYDSWLRGTPGKVRVIKDVRGRVVDFYDTLTPVKPGRDMTLALDQRIQYFTYRALKRAMVIHQARAAAAIVLDARTGEILALASQPGYNPNDRSQLSPKRTRNHAVSDLMEPGSTVKPFIMAKALDLGLVQPEEVIDTSPGRLVIDGEVVRDDHNKGPLTPTGIIQHSSNVGISKIALRMDPKTQWQLYHQLGFDQDSGLFLHGEALGQLKTPDVWSRVDQAWTAFGYGFQVTLLQLARAYLTLASDGMTRPLQLFRQDGVLPEGERVFSVDAARCVRAMMEKVTARGGTAPKAHIPGYSVAGKTGTAHKLGGGQYSLQKYRSLFAGIVPADDPEFVMVVMVDEPSRGVYYGGAVAAPVFQEVMRQALRLRNVPPDREE